MPRLLSIASLFLFLGVSAAACHQGPETTGPDDNNPRPAAAPAKGEKAAAEIVKVPLLGAKIRGEQRALVTIVEVSDYACPFCKKAHATVETLLGEYGADVRLAVFENPLPIHETAAPAAKWAFAAGEQGQFWQARDALFEHQKDLGEQALAALAKEMGLDAEKLERDRGSASAEKHVQAGLDLARSLGVKGTPTFFINGRRLAGAQPVSKFRATIDTALAEARKIVAAGTRPEDVYSKILQVAAVPSPAAEMKPADDERPCGQGEDCGCKGKDGAQAADEAPVDVEIGAAAPIRGPTAAPVTVVVFTDFECPFCAKAEVTLKALEKAYDGKMRLVYKAAPLPFHVHAGFAARAALAAHQQGRFFEYRDALFGQQGALDRATLVKHASALGLDVAFFEADLDSSALEEAVAADVAQMKKLGVEGTPTFFINGKRLVGAQPQEAFRREIDRALAERR